MPRKRLKIDGHDRISRKSPNVPTPLKFKNNKQDKKNNQDNHRLQRPVPPIPSFMQEEVEVEEGTTDIEGQSFGNQEEVEKEGADIQGHRSTPHVPSSVQEEVDEKAYDSQSQPLCSSSVQEEADTAIPHVRQINLSKKVEAAPTKVRRHARKRRATVMHQIEPQVSPKDPDGGIDNFINKKQKELHGGRG